MSTHNIRFCGEIRKISVLFGLIQALYFIYIIIRFLINVPVQGQQPHQWAPFQIAGLLHAWQISHQISRYVYHEVILGAVK